MVARSLGSDWTSAAVVTGAVGSAASAAARGTVVQPTRAMATSATAGRVRMGRFEDMSGSECRRWAVACSPVVAGREFGRATDRTTGLDLSVGYPGWEVISMPGGSDPGIARPPRERAGCFHPLSPADGGRGT